MSSWEEEARQFLLEEEEEDDELFLVLVPAILLAMQEEKRAIVASAVEPVQHVPRAGSEINVAGPSVGSEANVAGLMLDQEACEVQSPPSVTSVHRSGKKRKKSQVASVLDDYLEHKKKQTQKIVEMLLEKKSREEEYSIKRCLDTVDAMEELTDEDKAIAAEVFKNELNREMFVKQKNLNVRLIWLRRKISRIAFTLEDGQCATDGLMQTRS